MYIFNLYKLYFAFFCLIKIMLLIIKDKIIVSFLEYWQLMLLMYFMPLFSLNQLRASETQRFSDVFRRYR